MIDCGSPANSRPARCEWAAPVTRGEDALKRHLDNGGREERSAARGRLARLKAVVVGGAGGIGSAIARRFVEEGAVVAVLDVDAEALRVVAKEVSDAGGEVTCIEANITSAQQVREIASTVDKRWGRVDILVNAAGVSGRPLGDGPVHTCTESAWDQVLAVNLTGVFLTCKYFVPLLMQAGAGSVVHIASDDALIGPRPPHDTHAYIASKGGIIALTRAMAVSYAPQRIRVNAIAPGWIATPMTTDLIQQPEVWNEIVARHPIGRAGTPDDVAMAAVYLASPEASFVTGVILPVEGGATVW